MKLSDDGEMIFSHQSEKEYQSMMYLITLDAVHSMELISLGSVVDEVVSDFAKHLREWNLLRPHFGDSIADGILVTLSEDLSHTEKIKLTGLIIEYLQYEPAVSIDYFQQLKSYCKFDCQTCNLPNRTSLKSGVCSIGLRLVESEWIEKGKRYSLDQLINDYRSRAGYSTSFAQEEG